MVSSKILLAAAALAVAGLSQTANAAPWDHPGDHPGDHRVDQHADHRGFERHDVHRPLVVRDRVFTTLRLHHYRGLGDPVFVRGHYVVRTANRFGRTVFVEIDPYSGAFIGEFRI